MAELRALLVTMGDQCNELTFQVVHQPDERSRWTEAPIESDDEDAEVIAVI